MKLRKSNHSFNFQAKCEFGTDPSSSAELRNSMVMTISLNFRPVKLTVTELKKSLGAWFLPCCGVALEQALFL